MPASLLVAEDDPVIPVCALDRVARPPLLESARAASAVTAAFHRRRLHTWLDDYLAAALP